MRPWRDRRGGMETSDIARLIRLEGNNRRKDRVIAPHGSQGRCEEGLMENRLRLEKNREGALQARGIAIERARDLIGYTRSGQRKVADRKHT